MDEVTLQRQYYAQTAGQYDDMHGEATAGLGLPFLSCAIEYLGAKTVLDVGAGTGTVIRALQGRAHVVGVEPVKELREQGHRNGIDPSQLVDGNGYELNFPDGSFDLVCEFAMLHHVKYPNRVVQEMLRVARRGVVIVDSNNFGQGSAGTRVIKQALHALKLWPLANYIKTRGKGYIYTEGDGISYSYSVFDSYPLLAASCSSVHVLNIDGGINPYRTSAGCALLGIKGNTAPSGSGI